jgi:hypothetical protein
MMTATMLAWIAGALCIVSIVALAIAGKEPPHRIRSLNQMSAAEREFYARGNWWGRLGYVGLIVAAAGAITAALLALR